MSAAASQAETSGPDDLPGSGRAPPLPIERPLVQAVRALEGLKSQADLALFLLENAPNAGSQIQEAMNGAAAQYYSAFNAVGQFLAVRSCEGQG